MPGLRTGLLRDRKKGIRNRTGGGAMRSQSPLRKVASTFCSIFTGPRSEKPTRDKDSRIFTLCSSTSKPGKRGPRTPPPSDGSSNELNSDSSCDSPPVDTQAKQEPPRGRKSTGKGRHSNKSQQNPGRFLTKEGSASVGGESTRTRESSGRNRNRLKVH
ncbi:unnamed protein product, partial [Discosporangium mesarthrocarpum]